MKIFLLSLLPWSRKEWSDFIADLAPLLGLFVFAAEPRNIMLPLYPELYFVFGYGLIRLTSISLYAAYHQGKDMGLSDLDVPEPWIGKIFYVFFILFFGAILILMIACIIALLIGFNFFFYLLIELFLTVACTGGMEANFIFLTLYNSLAPSEQYYIWGMFLFTLYRYMPRVVAFFKNREYRNESKSWAWLALGTAPIPEKNQFQLMVNAFQTMKGKEIKSEDSDYGSVAGIAYFSFLVFYFGSIILMIKLPLAGPVLTLVVKAFFELYYFRLHKEVKRTDLSLQKS